MKTIGVPFENGRLLVCVIEEELNKRANGICFYFVGKMEVTSTCHSSYPSHCGFPFKEWHAEKISEAWNLRCKAEWQTHLTNSNVILNEQWTSFLGKNSYRKKTVLVG